MVSDVERTDMRHIDSVLLHTDSVALLRAGAVSRCHCLTNQSPEVLAPADPKRLPGSQFKGAAQHGGKVEMIGAWSSWSVKTQRVIRAPFPLPTQWFI